MIHARSSQFKTMLLVLALIPLAGFQNCSKAKFSSGSSASSSTDGTNSANGTTTNANGEVHQPGSCDAALSTTSLPIKTLFIVDMSGSNYSSPGTDPQKKIRAGSIQTYFDDYKAKTNFSWGFIGFQGTSASAFINSGLLNSPKFSTNTGDMQLAIYTFEGLIDDNTTPYNAALNLAKQAIANDSASGSTKYVIVFLSDGMPTDYAATTAGDNQLDSDVTALVNTLPGRISFNTIYYGPVDAAASNRLHNMATAGNGEFLDTNLNATGSSFYISDTIKIPGVTCQ